jgi:hypothetical protein
MDSKQSPAEDTVRDQAALIAWEQCLKENGVAPLDAPTSRSRLLTLSWQRNKRVTNGEQL